MNSAVYRLLLRMSSKLKEKQPKKDFSSPRIFSDRLNEPITDCSRIKNYDSVAARARDYILLAFDLKCWDEDLLDSVDSAVRDMRRSVQQVSKVGGKVRVFIVPAAWAFENEGIAGRASVSYQMTGNATITAEPLVEYVTMKMADMSVEVVSLEKMIKNIKLGNKEKIYFSRDGHWTKNAHKVLGKWMAETFYQ